MLRTEFLGSGSKLVISWDVSSTEDDSVSGNSQTSDKLVERINQLYGTISKFSTEFVQCMRQVQCFNQSDKIPDNLNLSFKISDSSSEEKSAEISRLHQELDDLKKENDRLEIELKNKNDDLSNLQKKHEQDERDLRDKYQKQMSELRVYFEKFCHANYERDIVNNLQNRKNDQKFNLNSKNEMSNESYRQNGISFDCTDCDLMNKSKDTTPSDLKMFIVKAYNAQIQKFKDDFGALKNEEMEKLKDDKKNYSTIIETLQSEVNRLEYEKALEGKVKEIHDEVKQVCRIELDELQDASDHEFLLKIKNDKETFENAFKHKFESALHEINDEWESKVEVLSELLVRESLKVVNLEENIAVMTEENENLKVKLIKCMEVFSLDDEEANIERIAEEVKKMKEIRERENNRLQNENTLLLKKIEDLQQRIPPANSSREKVITALIEEITDLIAKEQLGQFVSWPSELSSLEKVFSKRSSSHFVDTRKQNQNQYLCFDQLENYVDEPLNGSLDLNQLIDERESLRKVNVALKGVINMFTRYLTKCEEGRDHTFIEALINAEKLKKNLDSTVTDFETSTCCTDVNLTVNDERKRVRFASNVSEFVHMLEENEQPNGSHDHSVSVTENDLKSWLQIVRNEASVVLKLISDQKTDVCCDKKTNSGGSVQTASEYCDEGVQTDVSGGQLDKDAERICFLQDCVQKAENQLSRLNAEISYLKERITPSELIEGYGEANHPVELRDRIPSMSAAVQDEVLESDPLSESDAIYESDEYCAKCDKVKREARKEIEDLQLQIRYLETKLERNQKNLERHTLECDAEREEFEKEIKLMKDHAKDRERDIFLSAKEKFKSEIASFEQQVKDLNTKLEENIESKKDLEAKLRSTEKRLKIMRDSNSELESKLAESSESAAQLETKLKIKETELRFHQTQYENLLAQFDSWSEMRVKQVEEFNDVHTNSSNVCDKMKVELKEIEKVVSGRTRILENTYLPVVVASSVLSSPSASEDISVSDVVCERARLFSPNESDMSSPPSRRPVSFDVLSCLHEKLSKLFRAEDAAFKKIRDQEMQIAKINDELRKVELERDVMSDSLRNTSSKLSEKKIEMENLQHSQYPYQSIAQLELTNRIRKLESQIKHYKKYLSQKDYYDAKVGRTMANMQALISDSNLDSRDETAENLQQLRAEFEEFEREKRRIQEEFDSLDAETDESSGTPRRKIRRLSRREAFTPADGKDKESFRRSHVSFAENLESFIDSDVTRRAPAAVVSPLPRPSSIVENSSDKVPLLNSGENTLSLSLQPQKMRPNFDVERISVQPIKNMTNDSINLNSDAFSSIDCNAESRQYTSSSENPSSDSQESELNVLRNELEQEKQRHQAAVIKLLDFNNEKKLWKKREGDLTATNDKLEYELCATRGELNLVREQCSVSEEQVTSLKQELNKCNGTIDKLEQELQAMERLLRDEVDLDKERRKSDEYCRAVVKERIGAELRCEQFSDSVKKLVVELRTEKSKSSELSRELEKAKNDIASVRETLQGERELIDALTETNRDLKTELERLNVNKVTVPSIGRRTESLRDLTEKVQKEVELAVELDEHLYKNLESTSESSSKLLDFLKVSPTLSQDVKKVLFKLLRSGYQNLLPEDKKILADSFGLLDANLMTDLRQVQEANRHLINQMENEKLVVGELTSERNYLRSEVTRLETVLAYYDERMTFLVSKVDDYRNRYVKTEIELTALRCSRSQLESQIRTLKKESNEVKTQLETHAQKFATENEALMKENLDSKQKIGTLKNQVEALTAELNSMKVISQYHSESENELSRSLNPLKSRLEAIQLKYCRVKNDLEGARSELQKVKLDLKIEKIHNQQLEERYKSVLQAKREVEGKLIDSRTKLDNLMWQKQKVDDKLNAIELAEIRTRKVRVDKDNMSKKETDLMRCQMEYEYTKLKENILKIRETFISLRCSWKEICERSQKLYYRMLTAEKNQRCLVYQKNYLLMCGVREPSTLKACAKYKFKSVATAVISLRRLKFLSQRRLEHSRQKAVKYFTNDSPNIKFYPWFDFIIDSVQESNHSEESESSNEVEFLLIDDSLKALHQQYKNLLSKYD